MLVFQNSGVYPAYLPRLRELTRGCEDFRSMVDAFLHDRYGAAHFLLPVLDRDPDAFFTNGDDVVLQRRWADENGMPASTTLEDILLAQIEHHRADVFYNMDPMRYGSAFVKRLPACVRASIAWRAAPSAGADFGAYNLLVCNFPGILADYAKRGWRSAWFAPAHDPEMDAYAANTDRPVDVLFVGGYSRHHSNRAHILEAVAAMRNQYRIVFHLDRSRLTRLAESLPGRLLPLGSHRRPSDIRAVSFQPVFGRDLYAAISRAKIVLNGAVDMAGQDRGNMRCFEATGCGALMVSDTGLYPPGFMEEQTMLVYSGPHDAAHKINRALQNTQHARQMASAGLAMLHARYSKTAQWAAFRQLVETAS